MDVLMDGVTATNNTDLIDNEFSKFSRSLLTFAAILTILIMLLGLGGNLLTIIALIKCPKVRNVAAAFIISLCVADFIFCVIVLPFSISSFIHRGWVHGSVLCIIVPFMRYGNVGVSLLSIAMITINRYIMIAHHARYGRIYKTHWIAAMIVFCWVFSYGFQIPTLLGLWGEFGLDPSLGTCSIIKKDNRSAKIPLFIIAFIVPCIIIICCYARIFWVVHSSEVRMRKHKSPRNSSHNSTKHKKTKEEKATKAKRNEWRITKMVLAIFLSYVICYLPITIVKVVDEKVNYPGFHMIGYILLYFSACVNPIIYVIMNKQYRQAYKSIILCRSPRTRTITPANASSYADKSRDGPSKTMVSHVSFALSPIGQKHDELPEVFDDKL